MYAYIYIYIERERERDRGSVARKRVNRAQFGSALSRMEKKPVTGLDVPHIYVYICIELYITVYIYIYIYT